MLGTVHQHQTGSSGNIKDVGGDPLVTSRPVAVRELTDLVKCIPCQRSGRLCHVKESDEACMTCIAASDIQQCVFQRKIFRRINDLSWSELIGYDSGNAGSNGGPYHYQSPSLSRAIAGEQQQAFLNRPTSESLVTGNLLRRSSTAQDSSAGVTSPGQREGIDFSPLKRSRTQLYDGRNEYARYPADYASRKPICATGRSLPIPLDQAMVDDRVMIQLGEERKQDANSRISLTPVMSRKSLDVRPPQLANSSKRKLELPLPLVDGLDHVCSKCRQAFKTPAELKKHFARHEPQYFCDYAGCVRMKEGFTTKNDLDRHRKTMHRILSVNDRYWKCFYQDCAKNDKVWPRLDNFKAHIARMHGVQHVKDVVTQAEEWWDTHRQLPVHYLPPDSRPEVPPTMTGRNDKTSDSVVKLESHATISTVQGRENRLTSDIATQDTVATQNNVVMSGETVVEHGQTVNGPETAGAPREESPRKLGEHHAVD